MRVLKFEDLKTGSNVSERPAKIHSINLSTNPEEVLLELFELLEEYGPTWYKEEHHNRAVDALMHR